MPRPPRAFEPNVSIHAIHRGNNRVAMFGDDVDFELFVLFLKRAARQHCVRVHAYVLMTNHYHLIVTPEASDSMARMMKGLNVRYVQHFNRKYDRIGTLLNGRFRSIPIIDEAYWLSCLRYVELNPVRARMVREPGLYRWSTYRAHAFGEGPSWLDDHPSYQALGPCPASRQAVYRALCRTLPTESEAVLQKFHAEPAF